MKILCSVFMAFIGFVAVTSAISADDEENFIEEQTKICIEKNYPGQDWQEVVASEDLNDCSVACILTGIGLINNANHLVPEKLNHYISVAPKGANGKTVEEIREVIGEACKSVSDPDVCKAGYKILTCLIEEAEKLGIY